VISGNVRDGIFLGENDLNKGALSLGLFGSPVGPKSYCSQEKVTLSPSGSEPLPVKVNGVLIGMVNPDCPASTLGGLFPVAVISEQVFPEPSILYAIISS
jgi:hypothetical protein